jgi:RNA polymerase sigma factor (sigma-70 family)
MVPACDDIPDFELIRRMADETVSFAEARHAWGCFYLRHYHFLLRVSMSDHRYVLGVEGVKDVVQQTLLKAYDRAKTFDHTENCDLLVQERKCRAWLLQIAENIVRDRFRNQPEICLLDEGEIEKLQRISDVEPDNNPVPDSKRLRLLKSGFALLSDVEQTVLRATMFYWRPGEQHQRMPHAALLELSNQIGKSSENIRQIRSRAVTKLEKYVNENLDNEKTD